MKKNNIYYHQARKNLYIFHVTKKSYLLNFLFDNLKNISKHKVKSLLKHKQILINNEIVTQFNYQLYQNDEIKIIKTLFKNNKKMIFDIIYEDDDFIVINKPNGLLSVQTDKKEKNTAFNLVKKYLFSKNIHKHLYIVHRLDKDTSGILIFTKKIKLKKILQDHWNNLVKKRFYYAIVKGVIKEKEKKLTNFLKKNKMNIMQITKNDGKKAITHFKVIKRNDKYTLLNIDIKTGKQNQIRLQLSNIKHCILGDYKYGSNCNPLKRLALHAYLLEFIHPFTNKKMIFKLPMPNEFKTFMYKNNK